MRVSASSTTGDSSTTGLTDPEEPGALYFTDRGIEELVSRRGDEEVTLAWLGEQLQGFVDAHPEHEAAVERFATWLARLDDPED